MTGRTPRKISAAVVAALLAALACAPAPARAADLLPDLVADEPFDHRVEHDATKGELLLRFNGYVHNAGLGDLLFRSTRDADQLMGDAIQTIASTTGPGRPVVQPAAELRYETNDSHRHWHLMQIARYGMVAADADVEVAPSHKVGFCLVDSQAMEPHAPPWPGRYPNEENCLSGQPSAPDVSMGLSGGYRDIYSWDLAFQWIDVSQVQPGLYRLRAEVDPESFVKEADEVNPPAFHTTSVPGYLATPQAVTDLPRDRPSEITLSAAAFDGARWTRGARQLRVVDPPEHGTLDVTTGSWFSASKVVYTPDPGHPGTDSFTFAARDSTSPFPRSPAAAAVTLALGDAPAPAPVAVSGAPQRMVAGTSIRLTASRDVTWSVADAAQGTIAADGLYTAPAVVPAGGVATIRATPSGGDPAEVRIAIDPVPAATAAPAPDGPSAEVPHDDGHVHPEPGPGTTGTLTPSPRLPRATPPRIPTLRLEASRKGGLAVASVRVLRRGTVRMSLLSRGRSVRSCSVRAIPGRTYGCRLRIPPRARGLALSAVLRSPGRAPLAKRSAL